MQITTRWFLVLTLALTLGAPGLAWSEAAPRSGLANREQLEPPPIQVIRRIKVGGAYPVEKGVKTGSRNQKTANNKSKTKANSKRKQGVKTQPLKFRSIPIRSAAVSTSSGRSNVMRSIPIQLNTGRA